MDNYRDNGGEDDENRDGFVVGANAGNVAQEITHQANAYGPQATSKQIVRHESGIFHLSGTGHDGSKRAYKRYKAGNDYGFGTVFGIKVLSRYEMVFFK